VQTVVGYREVTLTLADGRGIHARAQELSRPLTTCARDLGRAST
jgi:hypothetical protein